MKTNQNLKIKRLKIRLISLICLLFLLVIAALFTYSGLSLKQIAYALSSNYNKTTGQQLTTSDWNNLPNDFVARTGGAASNMAGQLDMGNNKVVNLSSPTINADAVNKQYVDNALAGVGKGGTVFINWGRAVCPSGSNLLYSGFAFNNLWTQSGGGSEPVCISYGDAGAASSEVTDGLYPLGTGVASQLPPGIPANKEVKCALCYNSDSICYERWGGSDCPGAGFSAAYTGYGLGGHYLHANQVDRHCVDNVNFNGSVNENNYGSVWYGTTIADNTDLNLYTNNSYIKCALCCN